MDLAPEKSSFRGLDLTSFKSATLPTSVSEVPAAHSLSLRQAHKPADEAAHARPRRTRASSADRAGRQEGGPAGVARLQTLQRASTPAGRRWRSARPQRLPAGAKT